MVWTVEAAKARLSELLRQAREEGPQRISVRGRPAAVLLSQADYDRLAQSRSDGSWVDRMAGDPIADEIVFERDDDRGRDFSL